MTKNQRFKPKLWTLKKQRQLTSKSREISKLTNKFNLRSNYFKRKKSI